MLKTLIGIKLDIKYVHIFELNRKTFRFFVEGQDTVDLGIVATHNFPKAWECVVPEKCEGFYEIKDCCALRPGTAELARAVVGSVEQKPLRTNVDVDGQRLQGNRKDIREALNSIGADIVAILDQHLERDPDRLKLGQ